jgi:Fe2+ transport system protein FeoA
MSLVDLYNLKTGEKAVVVQVIDHRAREMGLIEGTQVSVLKSGNPCILKIGGIRIGVGHTKILVRRV